MSDAHLNPGPDRCSRWLIELGDGRTERVFDLLASGCSADSREGNGVTLIELCGYYGDVSAISGTTATG